MELADNYFEDNALSHLITICTSKSTDCYILNSKINEMKVINKI